MNMDYAFPDSKEAISDNEQEITNIQKKLHKRNHGIMNTLQEIENVRFNTDISFLPNEHESTEEEKAYVL